MSQVALQRGIQALEDELGAFVRGSVRRQRRTRNRPRVAGSWRDQGRGECFTRTNKNGGRYVVCEEGSKGQKAVYAANNRNVRGDGDQKGRKKDKAIRNNRSVMKKYDDEGRVEDLDEEIYFTPLREEGGFVILGRGLNTAGTAKKPDGISDNVDTTNTIRVPKDEFNAQYRVMRGFTNPDDKYNDLAPAEYELQEDAGKAVELQKEVRGERLKQEAEKERVDEFVKEAQDLGGGRQGFRRRQRRRELGRQAIRKIRETRQERLNKEQFRKDLVEGFERKVRQLRSARRRRELLDENPYVADSEEEEELNEDIIRLEREVGQELDVRNRKQKEEEEERERIEREEREEERRETAKAQLELGLRTLRDRRSGIIQSNQYYDEGGVRTVGFTGIPPYYQEGIDAARQEVGEEDKEDKEEKKKKKKKKKKPKLSKRGKAEERAKEAQGDDYDEEEWEEEYEDYLERKKEFDENKEEFKEEPLFKRIVELGNEIQDAGADFSPVDTVDKTTGEIIKAIRFTYRGRTVQVPRPQDSARVSFGYDGEIDQLFAITLRSDIEKLEDFLAFVV